MRLEEGKKLVDSFIHRYFNEEQRATSRLNLLKYSIEQVVIEGLHLEFGVWKGASINYLASIKPYQKFYGFDSFKGLPEEWSKFYPKGHMEIDKPPQVRENVELVIGLFQDTLKNFLEAHPEKIAFLHLDADLYASTKFVLFTLADHNRIQKGTVIEFDEVFYQDSPKTLLDDEYRVYNEFMEKYDVKVRWIKFFQHRATTRASLIIT